MLQKSGLWATRLKNVKSFRCSKATAKDLHTSSEFWTSKEVQSSLLYPPNLSAWYMHRQVYIKISTFRPSTLFVCVVRFSQFITITSLRRIHWFLFLSETHCVLCDVRTDILCTMWINFNPKTVKCKVGRMVFAVNNATLHRTDQY